MEFPGGEEPSRDFSPAFPPRRFSEFVAQEEDEEDADGLVLELNTPGGTIHGSRAIADAVAERLGDCAATRELRRAVDDVAALAPVG